MDTFNGVDAFSCHQNRTTFETNMFSKHVLQHEIFISSNDYHRRYREGRLGALEWIPDNAIAV